MPNRAAVVIGINYTPPPGDLAAPPPGARPTPLRYAEDDAKAIAELLDAGGYSVKLLIGAEATREAIVKALREQRSLAGTEGLLLIHFSGHGDVDPESNDTAYLLPYDADPETPDVEGIALNELVDRYLGNVQAALTLLDCCHSGYAVGKGSAVRAEIGQAFGQRAKASFQKR
jgi:hypothetical protein